MKKTVPLMLAALFLLTALADAPLTVNGRDVSEGEIAAYLITVREAYADTAAYYETALGIDYWSLTYPNGQTVEQAVKADAFRGLVMLNVLYQEAVKSGLTLSPREREVLKEALEMNLPSAAGAGCSREELAALYEKQILSEKEYSYLLSYEEIDEEAAADGLDKSRYVTYDTRILYVPAGFYEEGEAEELLKSASFPAENSQELLPEGVYSADLTLSEHLCSDGDLLSAAKALTPGEVSPVIRTEYGLFLIKLLSVDDGDAFYLSAVEDAMRYAREDAYSDKYNDLYLQTEYTLDSAFWDKITLR